MEFAFLEHSLRFAACEKESYWGVDGEGPLLLKQWAGTFVLSFPHHPKKKKAFPHKVKLVSQFILKQE